MHAARITSRSSHWQIGAADQLRPLLIEQGVHIRVVQEVLGHTRVTTTERYTHVATLQMKDASERMSEAMWGQALVQLQPELQPWAGS
jgi:integrase